VLGRRRSPEASPTACLDATAVLLPAPSGDRSLCPSRDGRPELGARSEMTKCRAGAHDASRTARAGSGGLPSPPCCGYRGGRFFGEGRKGARRARDARPLRHRHAKARPDRRPSPANPGCGADVLRSEGGVFGGSGGPPPSHRTLMRFNDFGRPPAPRPKRCRPRPDQKEVVSDCTPLGATCLPRRLPRRVAARDSKAVREADPTANFTMHLASACSRRNGREARFAQIHSGYAERPRVHRSVGGMSPVSRPFFGRRSALSPPTSWGRFPSRPTRPSDRPPLRGPSPTERRTAAVRSRNRIPAFPSLVGGTPRPSSARC